MGSSNNKFCVVTPNYNMCKFLLETIESVLDNLSPGDQYFVVDGGSTDGSVDILKAYAGRITGWVSEPDRSYADAVSKGFSRSQNGLQCWIACGDLLLRGALDRARHLLSTQPVDFVFGDDLYIDEDCRILQVSNGSAPDLTQMMVYGLWTPLQDACFWRRSLYERVGGLDPEILYAADYDLFLRMALAGRARYTPDVFSAFRRHAGQTSNLRQASYKLEKLSSRSRVLASGLIRPTATPVQKAFYWLYPRLRSRCGNRKKIAKLAIGQYALSYHAAPTAIFGLETCDH